MSDSIIIWKYLTRAYPDSHQAIYQYCNSISNRKIAIDILINDVKKVFGSAITESYIRQTVIGFLANKKKEYMLGNITITPIYR